jgi:superfamily II DNA/RNA helicase
VGGMQTPKEQLAGLDGTGASVLVATADRLLEVMKLESEEAGGAGVEQVSRVYGSLEVLVVDEVDKIIDPLPR